MIYDIRRVLAEGLSESAFPVQLEKATVTFARLDERLKRSEPLVQRGLLARTLYREAQSLVGLSGRLIHLVDLVLFDLDTNVQMSSDASVLGRKYLAQLRRLATMKSEELVSAEVVSEISGLPVVLQSMRAEDFEPDEPDDLHDALSAVDLLTRTVEPRIDQWFKEIGALPVVLGSVVLLDAWQWHEGTPRTEIGPLLCSCYLRARLFTRLYPPVGCGMWNSRVRWERDAPPARRLLALAANLERSANIVMADLDRMVLARASMDRHTNGGARNESLASLADLFVEVPAVTTELVAKRLSITSQAALQLMKRLGNALPPELTGRSRYRAWGVL
jgi:hypothetical protein